MAPSIPHAAAVRRAPRVVPPARVDSSANAHALLAIYREAHRLHFAEHDFAAALAAWDRYLAAGPGPLTLEARYNRAIALAHLGRREEAIGALRPFADGESGTYRQAEALGLIEALRSGAASPRSGP